MDGNIAAIRTSWQQTQGCYFPSIQKKEKGTGKLLHKNGIMNIHITFTCDVLEIKYNNIASNNSILTV